MARPRTATREKALMKIPKEGLIRQLIGAEDDNEKLRKELNEIKNSNEELKKENQKLRETLEGISFVL